MEIRMEINGFNELYDMSWSGGRDTLDDIFEHDKEEELMDVPAGNRGQGHDLRPVHQLHPDLYSFHQSADAGAAVDAVSARE